MLNTKEEYTGTTILDKIFEKVDDVYDKITDYGIFRHKIFQVWFWSDVRYFIRKAIRFPSRIIKWAKIIFHDEDWDYAYLLYLLEFKLKNMAENLEKHSHHLYSDRDVKEIKVVISHIQHYRDIDKYVEREEYKFCTELTEDGYSRLKDNMTKRGRFLLIRSRDLQEWHWKELWKKISRKGRGWWD